MSPHNRESNVLSRCALLVIVLCIVGCAPEIALQDGVKRLSAQERRECVAQGGRVERILIGAEGCVRPTTDGGNPCTDSSQCQGRCDAPFAAKADVAVTGTCAKEIGRMGCLNVVIEGKASGEACFD